jgi:hypothetical protein
MTDNRLFAEKHREQEEKAAVRKMASVPKRSETLEQSVADAFGKAVKLTFGAPLESFDEKTKKNFNTIKEKIIDVVALRTDDLDYTFNLGRDSTKFLSEFRKALPQSVKKVASLDISGSEITVTSKQEAKTARMEL